MLHPNYNSQKARSHVVSPASPISRRKTTDDWEDWEDEEVVTPIETAEQIRMEHPPLPRSSSPTKSRNSRQSMTRIRRLKSRHRQKAQNARAGIKLITDMATLGRQNQGPRVVWTPDDREPKFVDAAALRALEGQPSSESIGNWNWFKKDKSKSPVSAAPQSSARTPGDGDHRIMIGFSVQEEEQERDAAMAPPALNPGAAQRPVIHEPPMNRLPAEQQVSVWSPDTPTPDSGSTSTHIFRPASSMYSQATMARVINSPPMNAPPVPAVPKAYKHASLQRVKSIEVVPEDDDAGTPCTLFEEDGSPAPRKQASPLQAKSLHSAVTPNSAESRSRGWWDHVITPFLDQRFTFSSQKPKTESPGCDSAVDRYGSPRVEYYDEKKPIQNYLAVPVPSAGSPPIVRAPTPRRTPSPRADEPGQSSTQASPFLGSLAGSMSKGIFASPETISSEQLPPYSPPKRHETAAAPVKFCAVFPPDHPINAQPEPTPEPVSPPASRVVGLGATMSSQSATPMTEIPITPTVPRDMPSPPPAPLPNRPAGTFVPQEHSFEASGPENRVERQRRRHEKEEVVARRVGGFWRGRGCMPKNGCFGRSGAEGRKRRRVCFGIIAAIIVILVLAIVIPVMLTRGHGSDEIPSIWVNLTDFPPMPTGVLTVVGPDNTVAKSGCADPTTLWSCALPKEQHESVAPFQPNQPTIVMQIQWDNSTRKSWDTPNGKAPKSAERRALGGPAHAGSMIRERDTDKFTPNPAAPSYEEMWFLGETTDNVTASEKAGEPAPFYISILEDANKPVDDPVLSKRQTTIGDGNFIKNHISEPDLLEDGTPAPAVLLPTPVQQPVRLYDRGLSTEHYAFYTYFKRTIYVKSTEALNKTDDGNVPLDEEGGCEKTEANYLTTWSQTRMLVQIWTKPLEANTSKLLENGGNTSGDLIRPGTMPYPVTVTLDTHGGNREEKFVWMWPMDERQKLDTDNPKLMANDLKYGGTVINHRNGGDEAMGGFDGGSGGCKCEWVNWV